jgi:hypothetical protein
METRRLILLAFLLSGCYTQRQADVVQTDASTDALADASVDASVPHRVGAAGPEPFPPKYVLTPGDAGEVVSMCDGSPCWAVATGGVSSVTASAPLYSSGGTSPNLSVTPGSNGQVLASAGGAEGWQSFGGDITCPSTIASCTVGQIGGTAFSLPVSVTNGGTNTSTAPSSSAQVLIAQSTSAYAPESLSGGASISTGGVVAIAGGSSATSAWAMSKGGLGQALTCASGNLLLATSTTLAQCEAMSGDCTISATGVVTCSGLQNQEIVAGASTGTLTCAAGATACGEAQADTSSVTPATETFTAQKSTNANGNGGAQSFVLPAPAGTGSPSNWMFKQGGSIIGAMGTPPGTSNPYAGYFGIWGGTPAASPSVTNYAFLTDPTGAYSIFNSSTYVDFRIANLNQAEVSSGYFTLLNGARLAFNNPSYFIENSGTGMAFYSDGYFPLYMNGATASVNFVGNTELGAASAFTDGSYGGGTGVTYFSAAGANPTTSISGGGLVYADHTTGNPSIYPPGVTAPTAVFSSTATTVTTPFDLTSIGTLSSGSTTGGSIVESYNGNVWAFGEQATSLPITPTLLAPGYSGTLNTLTSSSWVAAQNPTRANERFVRSITGGGSNTTTTMPMTALTDSRSATETAYITCECMVASTGNALGDVASARAVANYTYSHAGTLTTSGTPLLTDSIASSVGETLTVAWGVSSAQPTLTVTAASSNTVGSWACTVNTDERLN